MIPEIKRSEDGSHTLSLPGTDEHYHSIHGALQESAHVFIHNGLSQLHRPELRLFEMGFGTGLNALLSLQYARQKGIKIHYTGIERYPLEESIWQKLNYGKMLDLEDEYHLLHKAKWGTETRVNETLTLLKLEEDLRNREWKGMFDLVYFDAFSPDLQGDLWTEEIFTNIYSSMDQGGILVTYSAKGQVRRNLQSAGFTVERLPGPPYKREMLRAIRKGVLKHP